MMICKVWQVIWIVLKVAGMVDWSWWVVFVPLYVMILDNLGHILDSKKCL